MTGRWHQPTVLCIAHDPPAVDILWLIRACPLPCGVDHGKPDDLLETLEHSNGVAAVGPGTGVGDEQVISPGFWRELCILLRDDVTVPSIFAFEFSVYRLVQTRHVGLSFGAVPR